MRLFGLNLNTFFSYPCRTKAIWKMVEGRTVGHFLDGCSPRMFQCSNVSIVIRYLIQPLNGITIDTMHFRVLKLLNWNMKYWTISEYYEYSICSINNKWMTISWLHGIFRYFIFQLERSLSLTVCDVDQISIDSMACIAYIICASFNVQISFT